MTYAILCHPGHNRVYFEESRFFIVNELAVVSSKLSANVQNIRLEMIAGIQYLLFDTDGPMSAGDLKMLARLSFIFALYRRGDGVLIPEELPAFEFIDRSLSGILKYTGKTNEIFTRLLLNLAYFSLEQALFGEGARLLDPIAGKGTTLFEGLILDMNAYGIEIGEKAVSEVCAFLKKFLESEKYKHTVKAEKISGKNKTFTAQRHRFEISKSKDALKNHEIREFEIVSGNALYADHYYKKNFFHLIVGDLPYGVQHSSVTNEKQSSFTRNPKELLLQCLPVWKEVLKPRGVLALSWNTFVLSRKDLSGMLEAGGFEVFRGENWHFGHKVDQAIHRDIAVARKL
jgi:16S rRNA G966 N2-methylase RsmD